MSPFTEADRLNHERAKREALERVTRERQSRRLANPMAPDGLFDEVRRQTQELDL